MNVRVALAMAPGRARRVQLDGRSLWPILTVLVPELHLERFHVASVSPQLYKRSLSVRRTLNFVDMAGYERRNRPAPDPEHPLPAFRMILAADRWRLSLSH